MGGQKMTESDIQNVLGRHLFLQNICIPNVTMHVPGHRPYEADLIYFNIKSEYITEVEIKVTMVDFRNDFKKEYYHDHPSVKYLYYAMPESMYSRNKEEIDSMLNLAGIITISEANMDIKRGPFPVLVRYEKKARVRKNACPISKNDKIDFMRIGCMKWVNRKQEG